MGAFCSGHVVKLAEHRIFSQTEGIQLRHIFFSEFLIIHMVAFHCVMRFPFPVRGNVGPFVPVMPDQVITDFIGDHYIYALKSAVFNREHHVLIKQEGAAAPAHCIAAAFLFFIGKHDFLQLFQGSLFSKEKRGKKIFQIQMNRYLVTVSIHHCYVDQI